MHSYGVLIGRFQPFHNAHFNLLKKALEKHDSIIICIGSSKQARTPKNPFTAAERINFIKSCLSKEELNRVEFIQLRDYLYNDNLWITNVQQKVLALVNTNPDPDKTITLVGNKKDKSSYYLDLFPQWVDQDKNDTPIMPIDATMVRDKLFGGFNYKHLLPDPVARDLEYWEKTEIYKNLKEEYDYINKYKAGEWQKFSPTFVTVDALVIQNGHILLVKRKFSPGKGLYALPGGFLNQDEVIEEGILRELKEETGIKVPKQVLQGSKVAEKVFDHPNRSLRGRTITHAACFHLKGKDLAEVAGSDDAEKAVWMPLVELSENEDKFFEDHFSICTYFINKF